MSTNIPRRRLLLAAAPAAFIAQPLLAQSNWRRVAVPYYGLPQFIRGVYAAWAVPQADALLAAAEQLQPAVAPLAQSTSGSHANALRTAQQAWRKAVLAWDGLAVLALGPMIERRSLRRIDFTPTRPAQIERTIAAAPAHLAALESVGSTAKGFPALEWVLWQLLREPNAAAGRYAVLLAQEIVQEAQTLRDAFATRAQQPWDDDAAVSAFSEFFNQWSGGIERLRWAQMEKPLRAGRAEDLPRALSNSTVASWQAQWQTLRALALYDSTTHSTTDSKTALPADLLPVPLETLLRGRGSNKEADALVTATRTADTRVRALKTSARSPILNAASALSALSRLVQTMLAPALQVSLGFSDSDGD